ncbi:MAG: class I SAM-dependent methyltransferase [bacterium]|nr:class I SAM-dependent methyltransferase [bacterium]
MDRNGEQIPYSALFTAATWQWGGLPSADITAPEGSENLFRLVRWYSDFYRVLNPDFYALHEMLLHRHLVINRLLEKSSHTRVIEIAAGFSPRGCHYSGNPGTEYYEVDLGPVASMKRRQLRNSDQGSAILARQNFHLISGDATSDSLWQQFSSTPTTVITEGLMMYFDRSAQMALWTQIAAFVKRSGGEYLFDYIPLELTPKRSLAGRFMSLIKKALGVKQDDYYPENRSTEAFIKDLHEAGFSRVQCIRCSEVAADWKLPFPQSDSRVVIFHCE